MMRAVRALRVRALPLLPLLLLQLLVLVATVRASAAFTAAPSAPCTLSYSTDGRNVILNNSLIAVEIEIASAQWVHLYTYDGDDAATPLDLLGNGGYSDFDRANPDEIRPSAQQLTIVEQSDTFIHVAFEQNASDPIRNLPNFEWSFHFAIASDLRGVYVWTYVWHPADRASDYLAQYRFIIRANPGSAEHNYEDAPYDTVHVSPNVLRKQASIPQALAGETLWPPEAELIYVNDDAAPSSHSRSPARRLLSPSSSRLPSRSRSPFNTTTFVQNKYDFSVDNRFHAVYGFVHSQTARGMWMLTPSFEYKNSGPDSQDLTVYGPTNYTGLLYANMQMLNGNHYGSGDELVEQGEYWRKLYGPWLVYINQGADGSVEDAVNDAHAQLDHERTLWPYAFVNESWFQSENRFTITGTLVVNDPGSCPRSAAELNATRTALGMTWPATLVFLTAPIAQYGAYTDQTKRYMYWAYAHAETGEFRLPNVVSGTYELHAWSDGVLGEFVYSQLIVVNATTNTTRAVDLGTVVYVPERNASTLFEIGFPDRTATEYKHGNEYRNWGLWDLFAHDFPNGIEYEIGSSGACTQPAEQWRTQWNYAHVAVNGSTVDWAVVFDVPQTGSALGPNAYLRIAFAGISYSQLSVTLNGQAIGPMDPLPTNDKSVYRDGIHGVYTTRVITFPASVLKVGGSGGRSNRLVLHSDNQQRGHGLMYDALRVEVDGWKGWQEVVVVDE